MRRVAAALDTGPAHCTSMSTVRDGLLEAMFDRIIGAVKLETPDPSRWRAQSRNLLERVRAELVTHPGMAAATMVDPPRTEVAMRLLENLWESCLLAASTLRTPRGRPTSSRPR